MNAIDQINTRRVLAHLQKSTAEALRYMFENEPSQEELAENHRQFVKAHLDNMLKVGATKGFNVGNLFIVVDSTVVWNSARHRWDVILRDRDGETAVHDKRARSLRQYARMRKSLHNNYSFFPVTFQPQVPVEYISLKVTIKKD